MVFFSNFGWWSFVWVFVGCIWGLMYILFWILLLEWLVFGLGFCFVFGMIGRGFCIGGCDRKFFGEFLWDLISLGVK